MKVQETPRASTFDPSSNEEDEIEYIANMLTELKILADNEGEKMLRYLIEIAEQHALELVNSASKKPPG